MYPNTIYITVGNANTTAANTNHTAQINGTHT